MRRGLLVPIVAVVAAVAAGSAAAGPTGGGTITDAHGDVMGHPAGTKANYDIVSASYHKLGGSRLQHTVTLAGKAAATPKGIHAPWLLVLVPNYSGATSECDFYVAPEGVYACGTNTRRGGATVTRTGSGTIKYVFDRAAILNPRAYDWAFRFRGRSRGATVTLDRLPDTDDFQHFRLR
jgi:hypothetical protein